MKKAKWWILLLLLLVVVSAVLLVRMVSCFRPLDQEELPLALIQRTTGTEAALSVVGDYYDGESRTRLVCLSTTGELAPTFYAVELRRGLFQTDCRKLQLIERGPDIYVSQWRQGYVFFIGDPDTACIEVTPVNPQGEPVRIPVSGTPFSYYCDWDTWDTEGEYPNRSYQYLFYDRDGELIS